MSRVILYFLRAQRGIVALQSVAWDGGEKGHCCVLVSVSVSYVVPQAGGQLSCYFLTSFATSFGRRSARRFFPGHTLQYDSTSSTAQGGGGRLLWITDGRAKPLMDRKLVDVSPLSLSFSLFSLFLSLSLSFSPFLNRSSKAKRVSGPKRQVFLNECNCRRVFANIWFSHVWRHSSYTYAIPWWLKIWAWLRHEFLETAIPWWSTSKFWPRHELGMSFSFDCNIS